MADPTTVNRGLFVPTRGSDVGTWDIPVNANATLLDTIVGGIATIAVTNTNVTLNAAQYACGTIVVTGALSAGVQVIFPSVQGWWTVYNKTTNSSGTFGLYASVAGGAQLIGLPPGEQTLIQVNGASGVSYVSLDRVGSYLDLARSTVPAWISSSTIPPYLNCDGSTFSAVTYPYLADFLGGTTLPDVRGRSRFYLNGGTTRITTAGSGIDGNTRFAAGGSQQSTLTSVTNLPTANFPVFGMSLSIINGSVTIPAFVSGIGGVPGGVGVQGLNTANASIGTDSGAVGIQINNQGAASSGGTSAPFASMNPAIISGLCLIRAA